MKPHKSLFESKSAFLGFLLTVAGLVGAFNPDAGDWIQSNSPAILTFSGVAAVILRRVTSGSVTLFGN